MTNVAVILCLSDEGFHVVLQVQQFHASTAVQTFFAPNGISILLVVDIHFTTPIHLNKLLAHAEESRSIWPRLY